MRIPEQCLRAFTHRALNETNKYRLRHHVQTLSLADKNIVNIAQNYACHLANTNSFQHNPNNRNLGENLFMTMSTIPFNLNCISQCERMQLKFVCHIFE
jgi:hypothetical protein